MNPLGLLGGGGVSASSSASSGAEGGVVDTASGAFTFKSATAAGASVGGNNIVGLSLAGAVGLVIGFALCRAVRR